MDGPTREAARVGRRGTVVLPARLRRKYGFTEGSLVLVEEHPDGVMVRPAVAHPVDMYSPERIAELLLNNAVNRQDYVRAVQEVRRMGLDPARIPHEKP